MENLEIMENEELKTEEPEIVYDEEGADEYEGDALTSALAGVGLTAIVSCVGYGIYKATKWGVKKMRNFKEKKLAQATIDGDFEEENIPEQDSEG